MAKPAAQNAKQLAMVFNEIANAAFAIKRLTYDLVQGHEDERDTEAWYTSLEVLADRIGFLADWAAESQDRVFGAVKGSRAEDWMMPPAWHDEAQKAEEVDQMSGGAR